MARIKTEYIMKIHIGDSYKIKKKDFGAHLEEFKETDVYKNRSLCSLKLEWASHNFLYNLGLWRSHTKDVDLEWPQKWYWSAIYYILGPISWIFIK